MEHKYGLATRVLEAVGKLNGAQLLCLDELLKMTESTKPRTVTEAMGLQTSPETQAEDDAKTRELRYKELVRFNKQPIIYLDLDNTIAEFSWPGAAKYDPFDIGPAKEYTREFVWSLVRLGTVIIHTQRMNFVELVHRTREDLAVRIKSWLYDNNFPSLEVELHPSPFCVAHVGDNFLTMLEPEHEQNNHEVLRLVEDLCNIWRRESKK